jgi:hypothetical protein
MYSSYSKKQKTVKKSLKERCKIDIYLFECGDDRDVAIAWHTLISILDISAMVAVDCQNNERRYELTEPEGE